MALGRDGARKPQGGLFRAPWLYIISGLAIIAVSAMLLFGDSADTRDSEKAQAQAERLHNSLREPVVQLRNLLLSASVQGMAVEALKAEDGGESELDELRSILRQHVKAIETVRVLPPDILAIEVDEPGEDGYIVFDMILSAMADRVAPVQMAGSGEARQLTVAARLGNEQHPDGYVVVRAQPELVFDRFDSTMPEAGYLALEHSTGGNSPVKLIEFGKPPVGFAQVRQEVEGSMFRVVYPRFMEVSTMSKSQRLLLFIAGCLLLVFGVIRRRMTRHQSSDIDADPEALYRPATPAGIASADRDSRAAPKLEDPAAGAAVREPAAPAQANDGPQAPDIALADLPHELQQRPAPRSSNMKRIDQERNTVELSGGIFRAYDIRGIVGETLDAEVARQIGQAVGSLALDSLAVPVVVGRDGRDSGPDLVAGLVDGLRSTGCDVIDVGAVPTGVLYYACYELGKGSGVMVTGSHNPPDYNGFKVMIGGKTLFGDNIYGLFERIRSGNLRSGDGQVEKQEVLEKYRDRVAGDIQLKRPLKVVADCGNGIGGICAADVLRSIGAEVVPLFDEVDGTFPNHHPDPSEPENLKDLIESIRAMEGDIGVAFDGDADRLGVVTPDGKIVFPDRIMMLFAQEVLSRNPGATIIYDVKCTGHLDRIIRDAGGEPEMYKTGHSLIKNRMKDVGAPFAGEMSGHFFFKDRWYGFDCGIYSAARLLEILADDERTPQEVLDGLPDSVSTPELKVQMQEGENHVFIEAFQARADFEGARVSTIDGVRADYPWGWGLVRASNTTPVLVLRFDADDQASLEKVQAAFREQLLALNPALELPF